MPANLLVIGLDAAEPALLEQWSSDGDLPHLARVIAAGASYRLGNCMETLPGGIWPEIWSGRSSGETGLFYLPEQIHTGEAALRPIETGEMDPADNYWSILSDAGQRVCVVDQVQVPLNTDLNGIQILEWGLHDRKFGTRFHPADLEADLIRRHGRHPVKRCDHYGGRDEDRARLLADLLSGAAGKEAMLLDLLAREDWDLFTCTLSESHCAGHQFWHYLDSTSPHYRADAPEPLRTGLKTVYQSMDRTIGRLVEAAGPACPVLVVASHGMGPSHAGYHILPEFLARLGMGSDRGRGGFLRSLQTGIKKATPVAALPLLRAGLKTISAFRPVKAVQRKAGNMSQPLESETTRAVAIPNNRVGAIRLNMKGREPHGCVAPGNETLSLLQELREELLALEDARTGKPVVDKVMTADEVYGPDHHPDVPDLMVVFKTGGGPIDHCRSKRVGEINSPYLRRATIRTGDHTVESRLWACGPAFAQGRQGDGANILDIAPTVLHLLGVPKPERLKGCALGTSSPPLR